MVNLGQEQSMKRTQMTPELCANLEYLRVGFSTVTASVDTVKGGGCKVCKKELRRLELKPNIVRKPPASNSCVGVRHHSFVALVLCGGCAGGVGGVVARASCVCGEW